MDILAIGATGFIGSRIVQALLDQGHRLSLLHRGDTEGDLPDVEHLTANRYDSGAVRGVLARRSFDVALDVIPFTERQAQELVHALKGVTPRLVVLSSADVYRNYDGLRGAGETPPDPTPLAEDAPLRDQLYPYRGADIPFKYKEDYDKILVERAVMGAAEPVGTVLRVPAVYGPGDRQHRLRPYVQRMQDGRPFIFLADGQATWSWTRGYVDNVAAAVARAMTHDRAPGRIFNVGDEQAHPEEEWIGLVAQRLGWKGQIITLPSDDLPAHLAEPHDWRYHIALDTSLIRQELGFAEPVSEEVALQRTIDWEGSQLRDVDTPDYAAEDEAYRLFKESQFG
jgi:nucleoside-diphosphate-sugar epimerase